MQATRRLEDFGETGPRLWRELHCVEPLDPLALARTNLPAAPNKSLHHSEQAHSAQVRSCRASRARSSGGRSSFADLGIVHVEQVLLRGQCANPIFVPEQPGWLLRFLQGLSPRTNPIRDESVAVAVVVGAKDCEVARCSAFWSHWPVRKDEHVPR